MKFKAKQIIISILIIIVIIIIGPTLLNIVGMGIGFRVWQSNMEKGKKLIENMDKSQLVYFINDAKSLLSQDSLKHKGINAIKNLNEDYRKKGIIRIDVLDSSVAYVWMGGMDHTALIMRFHKDSIKHIHAIYNDYTRQDLFPILGKVQCDLKKTKIKGNKLLSNISLP
jgi:hypothetical protein